MAIKILFPVLIIALILSFTDSGLAQIDSISQQSETASQSFLCRTSEELLQTVQTCQPGQTIRLLPGCYRFDDTIHIKKNLSIIGEKIAEEDEIILESKPPFSESNDKSRESVLFLDADQVTLKNLTIRSVSEETPSEISEKNIIYTDTSEALRLAKGSVVMENCRIDGNGCYGIVLKNNVKFTATHCQVERCMKGLQADGKTSLILDECDFQHCQTSLTVMSNTDVKISNCRFAEGTEGVIFYHDERSKNDRDDELLVEQCDISGMANNGLIVSGEIALTVKDCRIHHCQSYGVSIINQNYTATRSTKFENCTIEENEGINVRIASASPIFTNCKFIDGHGRKDAITEYKINFENNIVASGSCIWVVFASYPKFVNCQISSKHEPQVNALVGIGYQAKPVFEKCSFSGNAYQSSVLFVHGEAIGVFDECVIKNVPCEAVLIFSGGHCLFENTVFESNTCGISCHKDGRASMSRCTFNNNQFGLVVMENGIVNCMNSRFENSDQAAILIKDQASGTFENNEIADCLVGILIRSEEQNIFRSNSFKNNSHKNWSIQCSGKHVERTDNSPNE